MADVIAVGHGASLTFSGFTAAIRSIGSVGFAREMVDASDLSLTNYTRKVPSGLTDIAPFSCEFIFNPSEGTNMTSVCIPPITGTAAVTTTITLPAGANTNGAKLVGAAWISGYESPELTSDGLMVGNVTIAFEGENSQNTTTVTWTGATNA